MKPVPIILITCDELRRDTLGCYGNEAIQTPHIDSLAAQGLKYNNFYTVSPWCLPARCSILTGKYPHRSGAYSNFRPCPLDEGADNIFKSLKRGGYKTGLVGKCHFAPVPYSETRPGTTHPYDEFKAYYLRLGIDHLDLQDDKNVSVWFYDDYSKALDAAGYLEPYRNAYWDRENNGLVYPFPAPAEWHPDMWVGKKAKEYIDADNLAQSTFTWISFSGPHYPYDTPQEYYDRVDESKLPPMTIKEGELDDPARIHHKSYHGGGNIDGCGPAPQRACKNYDEDYWRRLRISYHANMALIDDMVGEILKSAKEKYGDDCLILFTADHGEMLGSHGLWGKHNCAYDEVWRIPMIAKFPNQNKPETTDVIANSNDIFPTCLKAAGLEIPEIDGTPLQEQKGMPYTFAEGEGYLAVTDGTIKYIHIEKPGESYRELLDMGSDPHEFENQINKPEYAQDVIRMAGQVVNHFMDTVMP